jgi:hypothetical protein
MFVPPSPKALSPPRSRQRIEIASYLNNAVGGNSFLYIFKKNNRLPFKTFVGQPYYFLKYFPSLLVEVAGDDGGDVCGVEVFLSQ